MLLNPKWHSSLTIWILLFIPKVWILPQTPLQFLISLPHTDVLIFNNMQLSSRTFQQSLDFFKLVSHLLLSSWKFSNLSRFYLESNCKNNLTYLATHKQTYDEVTDNWGYWENLKWYNDNSHHCPCYPESTKLPRWCFRSWDCPIGPVTWSQNIPQEIIYLTFAHKRPRSHYMPSYILSHIHVNTRISLISISMIPKPD